MLGVGGVEQYGVFFGSEGQGMVFGVGGGGFYQQMLLMLVLYLLYEVQMQFLVEQIMGGQVLVVVVLVGQWCVFDGVDLFQQDLGIEVVYQWIGLVSCV